ncbi:CoA-binding domain-containing protein [Clostridium aceticum]|uniref:CoA-binding domain-containing protein n=1 Tax=Clostridium aceticum TaxID=84022 RepID=A0A0D8IDA4_9CLOT|nr:CoA-binding protein [Clostridium aceticum]AKL95058.1 CoA-binding domain-containing protein [Clostridium aceticum]KJF27947.1 CoA-binding protein [Clostridium aceticum]
MENIENNKKEMLEKKVWAVVGATPDTKKFGYKIYKKLKDYGYTVYGINPNCEEIAGDKIYSSLKDLPEKPECVDMVVRPNISKTVLDEIKALEIPYVWFQPGTFDEETISKAEEYNLKIVYYDCVLVALDQ